MLSVHPFLRWPAMAMTINNFLTSTVTIPRIEMQEKHDTNGVRDTPVPVEVKTSFDKQITKQL